MIWKDYIPVDIAELYEIHDFKHAAAILANEFPNEARELYQALRTFRFTVDDIKKPGGNESGFPKKFSEILKPLGWKEKKLQARTLVGERTVSSDTHKVDYLKDRVAFDFEWNSKDQTYDRDLYAFRTFFDFDEISVGILVTRSNELDTLFVELGTYEDPKTGQVKAYKAKYGASTTHMGKLIPRLEAGRNGGCPVLVFGITPRLLMEESDD
ncbi:hypothetical protein F3N42_11020 [Marinihelvus fidelis]|uniref:Restriction endonuclease n=1 Tax=Marinihelvus fidelis TaxID=2613842 RepID=A0A5N0T758_9GAMM|nr:BglII/BstYI family type II restriction endonuclease [Marinihelvus fidelis]KAA9130885.1 hypothetical protein F3N42_11020 [Marinihelvus fidelis]